MLVRYILALTLLHQLLVTVSTITPNKDILLYPNT